MEHLIITGFALLLIAPMIIVYYTQTNQLDEETTSVSVSRAATQIVQAADAVHYLGAPSLRTITIDLPSNINGVTVAGQSVSFLVDSTAGDYERVAWSAANLTNGTPLRTSKGPHVLSIVALEDGRVNITER